MTVLRGRLLNGKPWLLGTTTVSGGSGGSTGSGGTSSGGTSTPTYATSFTVSAPSSLTVGVPATISVSPVSGSWNGQSVTLVVSGLAGTIPAAATGSGTSAIVFQFTPTAAGSGTINASASGLTSAGAQNVTAAAAGAPGSYAALTDITYAQIEPWGPTIANNGDNYRGIVVTFAPVGGTGPFLFSIDNPGNWNVAKDTSGSRTSGASPHGWIVGPGGTTDTTTSMVLRITDATGASVTKTITSFDRSFTGNGIAVCAVRTWPNDVVPSIPCFAFTSDGTYYSDAAVTLDDPSGLWQASYQSLSPKSGTAPPPGTYPITLHASGGSIPSGAVIPPKSVTIVVTAAAMGGVAVVNRASVVSTASPAGWPVLTVAGTSPNNSATWSMDDPTNGGFAIDPGKGSVTVADPTKLAVNNYALVVHQSEGALSTSLSVNVPVVQGTNVPASAMSFSSVTQAMTNDVAAMVLGIPTVSGISGTPQWFIGGYTRLNTYAAQQHTLYLAQAANDDGAPAAITINKTTGQISTIGWLDAGLDGTSSFTYQISVYCTDGQNTCAAVMPLVVSWAPVSRTVYIGRGMASAHGSDGFEGIYDFRKTFVGSDFNPHTGTVHVLVYADADPDYYANDTGFRQGYDTSARFPWPGPIVVEGVAANGVAQPRTGGPIANNAYGGGDTRQKGFWVFGNGQGVLKNVEVSCVHGYDGEHGLEAVRKDGATYAGLSVLQCYIHDCDQGIETGNWIQGGILVDQCEIAKCGGAYVGSGATHNMYIGQISYAEITRTTSRASSNGHELKCRAMVSKIHNNKIWDGISGNASSQINLPNGGDAEVYNNIIVKGAMAQVNDALRYGEDLPNHVWPVNNLNFHDNQIDIYTLSGNHWGIPTVVGHLAGSNVFGVKSQVTLTNNSVWLAPHALVWSDYNSGGTQIAATGQTTETGTTLRTVPMSIDTSSRPFLSGALPVLGPFYRIVSEDNYVNMSDAGQYPDRDFITIPASTPAGTTICLIAASNDLVNQGAGTPNPWATGATPSLINAPVFYPYNDLAPPAPWSNSLFTLTLDSSGKFALKTAGTMSPGVYYAQARLAASAGRLSDWRYPVAVTA